MLVGNVKISGGLFTDVRCLGEIVVGDVEVVE